MIYNNHQHNMKKYKFIFLTVTSIIWYSCRQEVTLDLPFYEKPVFNCILNPDSTIRATLTLSKALNKTGKFTAINGADITLFENGVFMGKMAQKANGDYILNQKPRQGSAYKVEIRKAGLDGMNAQTIVPKAVKIEYIAKNEHGVSNKIFLVETRITDQPGKNYYWYYSYTFSIAHNIKLFSEMIA